MSVMVILPLLAACAAPTPIPTATPEPTAEAGGSERSLVVGDLTREYWVYIPPGLNRSQPVPVVFSFHGMTQDRSYMQTRTGFDALADTNSFVVIYPDGIEHSWNTGPCCGAAAEEQVDDVAFVREMLADVGTLVTLDPQRIHATGFSNGALLSFHLACEMSDTFAAIGSMGGALVTETCQPSEPVSVIMVHGSGDEFVPIEGGGLTIPGGMPGGFRPVEHSLAAWVQLNACADQPQIERGEVNEFISITRTTYAECQAGTAVELQLIEPFGHDWPFDYIIPVAEAMWSFFAAHPKQ